MAAVSTIPHLQEYGTTKQLIVKGKPFLMLGGELQNSSLSSAEHMKDVWPKMVETNVNTLLGAVTWEMVEPEEGKFDFEELDKVILDARKHDLHLILLWFGSFKNGRSTYAPSWVKKNPTRFPRAELRKAGGVIQVADVLSLFHEESVVADTKAFQKLMGHLKDIDGDDHTVLMVQVENEVGLLFDSRDGSKAANEKFAESAPKDLVDFLADEYDGLHPDLQANLSTFKSHSKPGSGTWEEKFGKSAQTDEIFMAYHYAKYVNRVAAAGKEIYNLPLYTNVWQNYAGEDSDNGFPIIAGGGGKPGDYPSGGATSNVLDIWLKFAPSLDFIAPDIYLNEYTSSCAKYRHKNNALFIPEQRRDEYGALRIWSAYGTHQALLASPFGIDTLDPSTNPFTKHFGLLSSVSQIILKAQRNPSSIFGFYFDDLPPTWKKGDADPAKPIVKNFGNWKLAIERLFVFGRPSAGSGIIIQLGDSRFLLIGWGYQISVLSTSPTSTFTGILSMHEKAVTDRKTGELKTVRVFGGDETRSGQFVRMPSVDPDYGGFPIAVTIPAGTGIAEVEVYAF